MGFGCPSGCVRRSKIGWRCLPMNIDEGLVIVPVSGPLLESKASGLVLSIQG